LRLEPLALRIAPPHLLPRLAPARADIEIFLPEESRLITAVTDWPCL